MSTQYKEGYEYDQGYEQGKRDAIERAVQCILWSLQAKGPNIHPAAKAAYDDALSTVRTAYAEGSVVMGDPTKGEEP